MKIGMIVAIREEIDALIRTIGKPLGTDEDAGYTIFKYDISGNTVYVAESGAGEIAASAPTQYLITKYGVSLIVNFGVCGGLTSEMSLSRTAVVTKAVHYDYDSSAWIPGLVRAQYPGFDDVYIPANEKMVALALSVEPSLKPAIIASADKFVEDKDIKAGLNHDFGAEICDMESAGILLTANRNKVPALLFKGVSDSVGDNACTFAEMVHTSAEVCGKVMLKVISEANIG